MRAIGAGAILLAAGCSLFATSARPHADQGALRCDSYAYPALDGLVGVPLLGFAGYAGHLAYADPDIRVDALVWALPALALGGCSLLWASAHPHRERSGAIACDSYALPVLDALVGLPLLAFGTFAGVMAVTDRESRDEATPIAVTAILLSAPLVVSAVVGVHHDVVCRRELP